VTDSELVAKKLAVIDTCCRELRELARLERIRSDVRERRFVEHTLQVAIRAAIDVASHIVSDERLGEPDTNRALFALLASAGFIDADLSDPLQRMVGFRNVLVHGYADVDLGIVEHAARAGLADLERFAVAVRARM
jgi:uncharacterized protein YutE (UPF0331/DUF86 family)